MSGSNSSNVVCCPHCGHEFRVDSEPPAAELPRVTIPSLALRAQRIYREEMERETVAEELMGARC